MNKARQRIAIAWDPYAQAREHNKKTIAAWAAKWQRMSALNLQQSMADLEVKGKLKEGE